MPIDTRDKRGSALLHSLGFGRVAPNPDGSLAVQGDRQQIGLVYRAILAAAPPVITFFNGLTTSVRLTGAGA